MDIGSAFSSILDINVGQTERVDTEDDHCDPVEMHDSISVIFFYITLYPFDFILSNKIIVNNLFPFKNVLFTA